MEDLDLSGKLRKSAHTLDTDELIKLIGNDAEVPTDTPSIDHDNDVLNFIAEFNLRPGKERIKQHTLYQIYKVWSQNPVKKLSFQHRMANYFEGTTIANSSGYLINQNAIKLTHAAYKYYSNENIRLKSKAWAKHFENFLKFHSLTKGNHYIDSRILYFIYDKFTHATGLDNHATKCLGRENFEVYCHIYLPVKKTKTGTLFGVSENIENFFQVDQLNRMKKAYAEEAKPKKRSRPTKPRSKIKPKNTL